MGAVPPATIPESRTSLTSRRSSAVMTGQLR